MTKARKAPAGKQQKKDTKWANILFLTIGALVVLSMILTSIFTQNPQANSAAPTPTPIIVTTPAP